ncbi:MAG: GNAT family N-acetyltransferase [Leptolyngbyaceae cyanobacterium]
MQIRTGQVQDSDAIAQLLIELDYPVVANAVASKIQQQHEDTKAALLVAVVGSQVLGFISAYFIPQLALAGDFCRISYFCVSPLAQHQGIGKALETAVCSLAKERGCDRIEVHCHARRTAAHRFYQRQGYTESPKYLLKRLQTGT